MAQDVLITPASTKLAFTDSGDVTTVLRTSNGRFELKDSEESSFVDLYANDIVLDGNLTVGGTTTTVNTSSVLIEDPILQLAKGQTSGTPTVDIGFLGLRGSSNNAAFIWDESDDVFAAILTTADGSGTTLTPASYADFKAGAATFSGLATLSGGARLMLGQALLGQTSGGTSSQLIYWGGTDIIYGRNATAPNNATVTSHIFRAAGNTRLTVDNSYITLTAGLVGTSATFSGNLHIKTDDAYLDIKEADGTAISYLGDHTGGGVGGLFLYNHGGTQTILLRADADDSYINTGGQFGIGTATPDSTLDVVTTDTSTNTAPWVARIGHSLSSGTAAANFGTTLAFTGDSTSSSQRGMAGITALWTVATDASRLARLDFFTQNHNTEVVGLTIKDGNVGIGTTAPVGRLEVSENSGQTAGVTKLRITARTQGAYDGDAHLEFAYNDWGNVNVPNLLASIQGLASVAAPSNVGGELAFTTKALGGATTDAPVERMRIKPDGNVGIGTTAPAQKLHVEGNIRLSINSFLYWGATGTRIVGNADYMRFNTGSVDALSIDSSQRVGIGTTAPTSTLSVGHATSNAASIRVFRSNSLSGTYLELGTTGGSGMINCQGGSIAFKLNGTTNSQLCDNGNWGIKYDTAAHATYDVQIGSYSISEDRTLAILGDNVKNETLRLADESNNYGFDIRNNGAGSRLEFIRHSNSSTGTVAAVIKRDSGNFGIGTIAPSAQLEIQGGAVNTSVGMVIGPTATSSTDKESSIDFYRTNSSSARTLMGRIESAIPIGGIRGFDIVSKHQCLGFATPNSSVGHIVFRPKGSEKVRIQADGNVGIGTTAPVNKLDVRGDFIMDKTNNAYGGMRLWDDTSGDYNVYLDMGRDQSSTQFHIRYGGRTANSQTWASGNDVAVFSNAKSWFPNCKVGIGTTAPATLLELSSNAVSATDIAASTLLRLTNTATALSGGDIIGALQFYNSDSTDYTPGVAASVYAIAGSSGGSGRLEFRTKMPSSEGDPATITMHLNEVGKVGIGTAAPSAILHVQGTMRLTGALYDKDNSVGSAGQILTTNGSATYWSSAGSGTISGSGTDNYIPRFNGTTALQNSGLYGKDDGNVGIGTPTPGSNLMVKSSGNTIVSVIGGSYTSAPQITFGGDSSGNVPASGNTGSKIVGQLAISGGQAQGSLEFWTNPGDSLQQRLTILKDGNVGIGTTAPTYKLQVGGGSIYLSQGTAGTGLFINDSEASAGSYSITTENISSTEGYLKFGAPSNETHHFVFDGGNVGIGETAPVGGLVVRTDDVDATASANVSQYSLNIHGNGVSDGEEIGLAFTAWASGGSLTTSYTPGAAIVHERSGGNSKGHLHFRVKNSTTGNAALTTAMTILDSGNVGIGTTAPTQKLQVAGNIYIAGYNLIMQQGSKYIQNASNGGERLSFVGSGKFAFEGLNVGIGTTAPTAPLTLSGANKAYLDWNETTTSTTFRWVVRSDNGNFQVQNVGGGTQPFVIQKADGNVGIGTASPWEKLTVYGGGVNFGSAGSTNNSGKLTYDSTNGALILSAHSTGGNTYQQFIVSNAGSQVNAVRIKNDGNVGIGTASPGTLLHMAGGSAIRAKIVGTTDVSITAESTGANSYSFFQLTNDARAWSIMNDGANSDIFKIRDSTAGADRFTINSSGNVGIGTTAPGGPLDIYASGVNLILNSPVSDYSEIQFRDNGTTKWRLRKDNNNEFDIFGDASGYTSRFHIKADGNVGIGTTSPGAKLHLADASDVYLTLESTHASVHEEVAIKFNNFSTGSNFWWLGQNQSAEFSLAYGTSFSSANTKFFINTDGKVGIGTIVPSYPLDVEHATSPVLAIRSTGANVNPRLIIDAGGGSGTADPHIKFDSDGVDWSIGTDQDDSDKFKFAASSGLGSPVITIQRDGKVGIGTTAPTKTLDIRTDNGILIKGASSTTNASISLVPASGGRQWALRNSGTSFELYDESGNGSRMFWKYDGNVGIGTTAPLRALHVVGGIYVPTGNSGFGTSGTTAKVNILNDGTTDSTTGLMIFRQGGDETFRVYGGGKVVMGLISGSRVGIGTASPASTLHVAGTGDVAQIGDNRWMGTNTVTIGTTYVTGVTINLANSTGGYLKVTIAGDWADHSAVGYMAEFFIQKGTTTRWSQPGTVIREVTNQHDSSFITAQILDPTLNSGNADFKIQFKTDAGTATNATIIYEYIGIANSVT